MHEIISSFDENIAGLRKSDDASFVSESMVCPNSDWQLDGGMELSYFKGIVTEDFGGPQMILMDRV